jgi:hypothetical protein
MHRARRAKASIVDNQVDQRQRCVGDSRSNFCYLIFAQQIGDEYFNIAILLGKCLQAFATPGNKHHWYACATKDVHHLFTDST